MILLPKENKLFLYPVKMRKYTDNAGYFSIESRSIQNNSLFMGTFHWHDYFEMEFFLSGEGTHILNGKTLDVKKGTIYLVSPADFHTLYEKDNANESGRLRYYNINFNEYALSPELRELLSEYSAPMSVVAEGKDYDILCREFEILLSEYESDAPLHEHMIQAVFERIFLTYVRILMKNKSVCDEDSKPKKDSSVRYIVSYLRLHFREPVSLTALAGEVHLTPNYIGELFRRETGMSFTEYVQRLRLNYATNLLVSSEMSVADISNESGFHSVSYFIRSFKNQNGKTPLEYRSMALKK